MPGLSGKRIVLGVSGGIAAYKAADVARELIKAGAEVTTVMTANACRFITPLTFRTLSGRPVATELFADPGSPVPHIALAQWADLIAVVPATADCLARAAQGRADDLLTAVLLDSASPVVWAPAMNTRMWRHPATQANVRRLAEWEHHIVQPESGALACGEIGEGRLAAVDAIVAAIHDVLVPAGPLAGKKILLTAGPTREAWDAVRFLSSRSTGKMGYALAAEARRRGADVTLISGPVSLDTPSGVSRIDVTTAQEMFTAALAAFPSHEIVIAAAAVADFRPKESLAGKFKKDGAVPVLALEPTPDILLEMARRKTGQVLVGFAAETQDLEVQARAKLLAKQLDLIVANAASGPEDAFAGDEAAVMILDRAGGIQRISRQKKSAIAAVICDRLEDCLRSSGGLGS